MTVHFRRRRLSRQDELGALSASVLVGLGGAALAYYLTRLLLSRERLAGGPSELIEGRSELLSSTPTNPRSAGRASGREG